MNGATFIYARDFAGTSVIYQASFGDVVQTVYTFILPTPSPTALPTLAPTLVPTALPTLAPSLPIPTLAPTTTPPTYVRIEMTRDDYINLYEIELYTSTNEKIPTSG